MHANAVVYESAVHPQTGETLPLYFRLSAFVPVNIPICAGMILAPPTVGYTVLLYSTLCVRVGLMMQFGFYLCWVDCSSATRSSGSG